MASKNIVHDDEELLDTLVKTKVLTTLNEEGMLLLIRATGQDERQGA